MCGVEDEAKKHYRRHLGSKTSDLQQDVVLSEPQRHSDNKPLTNIQRHSGSPQAKIRIERDPGKITLEINDKGSGISGSGKIVRLGVGIPSMQERVKLIGGHNYRMTVAIRPSLGKSE